MNEYRARAAAELGKVLDSEQLGRNLEVCIFNHVIQEATVRCIPRYWEDKRFSEMYKTKVRSMHFNLKNPDNPALRESVLDKRVSVKRLVKMTHYEMFPQLWEPVYEKLAQRDLKYGKDLPDDYVGAFQCGGCRSWKTQYTQLQTRSADGKPLLGLPVLLYFSASLLWPPDRCPFLQSR